MLKLKLFKFMDPSENQLSPFQVLISILTTSFFTLLKGTASVILIDPPVEEWRVRLTTVPFKPFKG